MMLPLHHGCRALRLGVVQITRSRKFSTQHNHEIGIIGMGQVGSAVANNLLRNGFKVSTYFDLNLDYPKWGRQKIIDNVERSGSCKEVAERSNVVITAVGRPPEVRAAVLGEDGMFAGMKVGSIWIEHSTSDYDQMMELTGKAEEMGFRPIEAPVTGGIAALRTGGMAVYAGGQEDVINDMRPILGCSCASVLHVGPLGTATITKVMSNMMNAVNLVAGYEAMMIAKKANIDLKKFFDAIRVSSGNSFTWETAAPFIMKGDYESEFALDLHCKDFEIGHKMAHKLRVPMEVNNLVHQIFIRARAKYGDDAGCYISAKLLEDDLNESLQHDFYDNWDYDLEHQDGSLVVKHKTKED